MRFSELHEDNKIQRFQREIEDNLADKTDLDDLQTKTAAFQLSEPTLSELSKDSDEAAYNDGSNYWLYRRIDGQLFKFQLTRVT